MEKYNKYLEPFNEFLLANDPKVRDLGWIMVINSIHLKSMNLIDLQQLNLICRQKGYACWNSKYHSIFLQKINKYLNKFSKANRKNTLIKLIKDGC